MTVCFSRSPICCDSRKLMKVTGHDVNKTLKHFLNISVFRKIFCLFEGAMLKKKKVHLSNSYAQMRGSQFAKLAV